MKKRFGIVILSVFILMVFACCSLSSQSVVPTVPDYATITAEAPEGYDEYFTSSRGQHCLGTTYCNEDKTLFQGYFYALRPLGQYHTGIQRQRENLSAHPFAGWHRWDEAGFSYWWGRCFHASARHPCLWWCGISIRSADLALLFTKNFFFWKHIIYDEGEKSLQQNTNSL